jgi:hypothetical protein
VENTESVRFDVPDLEGVDERPAAEIKDLCLLIAESEYESDSWYSLDALDLCRIAARGWTWVKTSDDF